MSPWIIEALSGHVLNAVAFIIDKTLLQRTFKHSATYVVMVCGLSVLAAAGIPWLRVWPPVRSFFAISIFGGAFVFALWAFFEALKRAEASRIVPIVGSLIPMLTFIGGMIFLHDILSARQTLGFALLLVATVCLSRGGKANKRLQPIEFGLAFLSAGLFALSSLAGKAAFGQTDFLSAFIGSRIVAAAVSAAMFILMPRVRQELQRVFFARSQRQRADQPVALAVVGQASGAAGFILVNLALSGGSPAVVNALQAVQYAGIVLAAWFGGQRLQRNLKEPRDRRSILIKLVALLLVAAGLGFIVGI